MNKAETNEKSRRAAKPKMGPGPVPALVVTPSPADLAELPLERTWVVWHNARERPPPERRPGGRGGRGAPRPEASFSAPKAIGSFGSIRGLWQWMGHLPTPSNLRQEVNLFIFQRDVAPAWEHPANREGGRWTCTYDLASPAVGDQAWQSLYLALAGETLEGGAGVTGATATRRQHYVRLAVWTRDRADEAAVMAVGRSLRALVTAAHLEYQDHGGGVRHALA